jgi:hypothetical protein
MDTVRTYGQQLWNRSIGFLNSDGLVPQLVLTLVIILVIHFIIMAVESFVKGLQSYSRLSASLLPYTYTSEKAAGEKKIEIVQKPSGKDYPFMYPSDNEINGVEFSYSFYLYVDPDTYSINGDANTFRNIFYKGGSKPWPYLGPGVFLNSKENTIRIYMNSVANTKDNFVEVPNIPVGKWFHMVITQKGQNMDVFINGNIAVRMNFKYIPMLNYGTLHVFAGTGSEKVEGEPATGNVTIDGSMKGMISRLTYYAYALSFTQIDSLYNQGPSKKIVSTSYDHTPPYLHDSWWVTRFNSQSPHYGL